MPLSQIGSYSHTYIRVTYRCHGLTRTSHTGIICHDICILAIPKIHTGLSDVVIRSKRIQKYSSQAYSHSAIAYINLNISIQHI
ncbi:hypothetical protein F383_24207 [Gossypium arboreum]|uniref:Uncharacterized protein n=1 Tax=Gossypium arboreum TaxID=29729 RepID=A0A0B0P4A3_GOSAR|nr:hypothetical protein F383_24207 [Gossypium arboreum]